MKRTLLFVAILAGFGLAKLPVEQAATRSLRAERLLSQPVDLGLRENLGQMGFAASLGGLRSLVASITYLQAYTAFENVDWAKVDSLFQLTTRLQPRVAAYWDEASWHMAYNAASSYLYNPRVRLAVAQTLYRQHVQRGIDILKEGQRYLPDNYRLWLRLGDIYSARGLRPFEREPAPLDHRLAGECYMRGFQLGALPVYERRASYEYVKSGEPELVRKAYDILMRIYREHKATPGVIQNLKSAEEQLHIDASERIPDPDPLPPRPLRNTPAQKP